MIFQAAQFQADFTKADKTISNKIKPSPTKMVMPIGMPQPFF